MIERWSGYRQLCAEIKALTEQIEQITVMATHCTAGWGTVTVMGSGYATSRVETAAVKLADVRSRLDERVKEYIRQRMAIEAEIEAVPDSLSRQVLEMRYLTGWSVERIAEELDVSPRWVQGAMSQAEAKVNSRQE